MTLPTQAARTARTHPAPISWSKRTSEIGPTRVRLRFRWRMISCPAAKGMHDSSPAPMTTVLPSGTNWAMASERDMSLVAGITVSSLNLGALHRASPFLVVGLQFVHRLTMLARQLTVCGG